MQSENNFALIDKTPLLAVDVRMESNRTAIGVFLVAPLVLLSVGLPVGRTCEQFGWPCALVGQSERKTMGCQDAIAKNPNLFVKSTRACIVPETRQLAPLTPAHRASFTSDRPRCWSAEARAGKNYDYDTRRALAAQDARTHEEWRNQSVSLQNVEYDLCRFIAAHVIAMKAHNVREFQWHTAVMFAMVVRL